MIICMICEEINVKVPKCLTTGQGLTKHEVLMCFITDYLNLMDGMFHSSILITYDDAVKISDFGTSKELNDKSTKMSFAGTVAWMAPEVIRNEPVSEKVDIW